MPRVVLRLSAVTLLLSLVVQPASAQSTITAPDPAANWQLDTTLPKAASRPSVKGRKGAGPSAPAAGLPPELAEKRARDAEAQRRYFDDQDKAAIKAATTPKAPAQFGGYDASTMSGTMRPGAGFKF